jgi:hypothetical protein
MSELRDSNLDCWAPSLEDWQAGSLYQMQEDVPKNHCIQHKQQVQIR